MKNYTNFIINILVSIIIATLCFTILPIINSPIAEAKQTQITQTQTVTIPDNNQLSSNQTTNKTVSNNLTDPPPAPLNVSISRGQSHNSVVVTWSAPATPPTNYTYQVDLINNISSISEEITNLDPNTTSTTLANLSTGNYNAIVYTVVDNIRSNPTQSTMPISVALSPSGGSTNFNDISKLSDNFQAAIKWAAGYGITSGYPDGGFHPATPTTRGQMATFFHKLAGNPNIEGTPTNFTDITESVHKNDINWLSTQGITAGYSCTAKGVPVTTCSKKGDLVYYPQGKITRQQMATFLYRFAASPTMSQDEVNSYLNIFKDNGEIKAGGQDTPIAWLLKNNITAGFTCTAKGKPEVECTKPGDIVFRPDYNATRQQMVLFLQKDAATLNLTAYLKTENYNANTFLSLPSPTRAQITKISFQNTLPTCDNSTDISADASRSIIACGNQNEIIIGSLTSVLANQNSSNLFSNLLAGVDINLTNLDITGTTDMSYMFQNSKLKSTPNWTAGFGSTALNMTGMFNNTSLPADLILPVNFGSKSINMTAMFSRAILPAKLTLPVEFGSVATDISSMFSNTILNSGFILPAKFGNVATNISRIFYEATLQTEFKLPTEFGSFATNMSFVFYASTLAEGFNLPNKFGSVATNISNMFLGVNLPNSIKLPTGFGVQAIDMSSLFEETTLPADFVLPVGFGNAATDMSSMFFSTTLSGDVDWSGTDLTNFTASKTSMFLNTNWYNHFILVQNIGSDNFLVIGSSISDDTRIKIKGATSVLKTENINPTTFLGVSTPSRRHITKIYFQNTFPICANSTDVSADGKGGVIACINNSTEIVIGANGQVQANADSGYLFADLSVSDGVDINLSNLDTSSVLYADNMFQNSKLKSTPVWPTNFGSNIGDTSYMFQSTTLPNDFNLPIGFGNKSTNMSYMWQYTNLPSGFNLPTGFGSAATNINGIFNTATLLTNILPAGFGQAAINMEWIFSSATLPAGFTLPDGFGNKALDMNNMFSNTTLNGDIDWSKTSLANSAATKNNMFYNANWQNHFILVKNADSVTFLITNSSISDNLRIKIKDSTQTLKSETVNPVTFLGISSPTRAQITKISFQSTFPTCSNEIDISANGKGGVIACINNSTEIIIGANGQIQTNADSSNLFAGLSVSTGVDINLTSLDISQSTNMTNMFQSSKLKSTPIWAVNFAGTNVNIQGMFAGATLPTGFSLPNGFGQAAQNMSYIFADAILPNNFNLPNNFGSLATNISYMWQNTSLPIGFTFPTAFGSSATNMNYMFADAKLNSDIDWSRTDLTNSQATKTDMFLNTNWSSYFMFVENTGTIIFLLTNSSISENTRIKVKGAESILKVETANPTNFLNTSLARNQITKISFQNSFPTCANPIDASVDDKGGVVACVVNNTEIVIGADGQVQANPTSSYLFANLSLSTGVDINLSNLDTSSVTNMESMWQNSKLKSTPAWPNNFGINTANMVNMFNTSTLPNGFSLPAGFGQNATNIATMFQYTALNSDVDWTNTDLSTSTAVKSNMFNGTVWNSHCIFVQNANSVIFLITNSNIDDSSRIKVKGASSTLKTESSNPTNFLGISSLTRTQITKIAFQNTMPNCSNPIDVSSDGKAGVLACVNNSTEIVVGADGQVQANITSNYLFENLTLSTGVDINLSGFNTSSATNMESMWQNSKLKSVPIWSSNFGLVTTDMSNMFADASLPINFSLPAGFGSVATDMYHMFENVTLSANFNLPSGFGSQATNISYIFSNAILPAGLVLPIGFGSLATNMNYVLAGSTLSGDIDWSDTDLTNSKASKSNMFNNTVWNNHYIIVQNTASRTFLITNSNISDISRIKIKGASSVLKAETDWPTTFLGVPSPTRAQITKITFQNTMPNCSNSIDVSSDGKAGVLACVENNTEIVVGADGSVIANNNSSYMLARLTITGGVDIDLTNLVTTSTTNMSYMFRESKLKTASLPAGFGSVATDISSMFYDTSLLAGVSLPAGFGSVATNISYVFLNTTFPSNFSLPTGFGSVATNMTGAFASSSLPNNFTLPEGFGSKAIYMGVLFNGTNFPATGLTLPAGFGSAATDMGEMFHFAEFSGDIDWSGTDLTNSIAEKDNMFINTTWRGHFILVQNQGSVNWLANGTGAEANNFKIKEN